MRTRRFVMLVLLVFLAAAAGFAQTSVGIIRGEPTGLSGKQWIGEGASLELAPGINLFPATKFNFGGGIGVRYQL